MEPRKTDKIPLGVEMRLRKAYAPVATQDEREQGSDILGRALRIVGVVACENRDFLVDFLKGLGVGGFLSRIIASLLNMACKELKQ